MNARAIFCDHAPNYHTTPTFSGARRRNLDTAQRKRGNLHSSSKFALAIVPTKQTSRPASDGLAGPGTV